MAAERELQSEVRALCAAWRHDVEKLRRPLRPETARSAAGTFAQGLARAATTTAAGGGKAASAMLALALRVLATELDTLHLELLSRCGAFDALDPALREDLWRTHLSALFGETRSVPSTPSPPPPPSSSSQQQQLGRSSLTSSADRGTSPSPPPRSPTPPRTPSPLPAPVRMLREVWPTLSMREEVLLRVLSTFVLSPTSQQQQHSHPLAASSSVSPAASPAHHHHSRHDSHSHSHHHHHHHHAPLSVSGSVKCTTEGLAQLWMLSGQMMLLLLRLRLKQRLIPQSWSAAPPPSHVLAQMRASLDLAGRGEAIHGSSSGSSSEHDAPGPDTPLSEELRSLLHSSIASGRKIAPESASAALTHSLARSEIDAGCCFGGIGDLLRTLHSANELVSAYFADLPHAHAALAGHVLDDEDIWGMWEIAVLTHIAECLAPPAATAEDEASLETPRNHSIGALHDVVVCWLFSCDPLLLAHFDCYWLLSAVLDTRDVRLLWEAAVHVLEPQYFISSKEGAFSLEESWRPFTLVRYKPERPLGMHCRDYLIARVFSALFRESLVEGKEYEPQADWSHWGKALWHDVARTHFTAIDISETLSNEAIDAILRFLASENCTRLTHINLQGTGITHHEIEIFPQSVKCAALSDCFLHDEDIEALASRCPHLEVVMLRNCDELTDRSIAALHELRWIKSADISGAVLTTHKARNKLREKGVHVKFEHMPVSVAFKLTGDFRPIAQAFVSGLEQRLAKLEETHVNIALADTPDKMRVLLGPELFELFVSRSDEKIGHPTMRESLRARVLKKALKHGMAAFTPLAMLVAEYCGIPGLKLGPTAADQIWHAIFDALPEVGTTKPPKTNDAKSWKQHTLEFVLATTLPQQRHWRHMPAKLMLLWDLSREHLRSINATACLDGHIISKALHDLAKRGIVLEEIHVSSEAVASIPECPVSVRKVFVHGEPLADATQHRITAMLAAQNIKLIFVEEDPADVSPTATPTIAALSASPSPALSPAAANHQHHPHQHQMPSVLDKESLAISTSFISRTRSALFKGAIKANSERLPQELVTELFYEVKAFEDAIKAYLTRQAVRPEQFSDSYNQFFCHCAVWLDVPQLLLLEYTGVMLRLALNQIDFIWRNAAAAHGFATESHVPGVSPRDHTIAAYLSRLLRDDPLDIAAAFVLQTCGSLRRLSLRQIDPLPLIDAEVREITVGGGEPSTVLTVVSLPSRVIHGEALRILRVVAVPDLQSSDVQTLIDAFPSLERLELESCPTVIPEKLSTRSGLTVGIYAEIHADPDDEDGQQQQQQ